MLFCVCQISRHQSRRRTAEYHLIILRITFVALFLLLGTQVRADAAKVCSHVLDAIPEQMRRNEFADIAKLIYLDDVQESGTPDEVIGTFISYLEVLTREAGYLDNWKLQTDIGEPHAFRNDMTFGDPLPPQQWLAYEVNYSREGPGYFGIKADANSDTCRPRGFFFALSEASASRVNEISGMILQETPQYDTDDDE